MYVIYKLIFSVFSSPILSFVFAYIRVSSLFQCHKKGQAFESYFGVSDRGSIRTYIVILYFDYIEEIPYKGKLLFLFEFIKYENS